MSHSIKASKTEAEQFERIRTRIFNNADEASREVASEIAGLIRQRAKEGKNVVLGLATGSTPVRLYRELIRQHKAEGLSFANVITFNLDEYYPLDRSHPESYHRFMQDQLFDHLDIPAGNINLLDGETPRQEVFAHCRQYEQRIVDSGGIDLQILGIGRTGHIGFNEPGSTKDSRTRLVNLDSVTRNDAAKDFIGSERVPTHAITMGVGSILDAKKVILLAWGRQKAPVLARAAEGPTTESLPASFLQFHDNVCFYIDEAAAGELIQKAQPWRVSEPEWTPALIRKAVISLSAQVKKPILKLVEEDYSEAGMSSLLVERGPAYDLNIRLFNEIQHTITGWPGGKPNADDSNRPERAHPAQKRVLILSPEPEDSIIAMGGTISRLIDQNHEVTSAFLTSGELAISDQELIRSVESLNAVIHEGEILRMAPDDPRNAWLESFARDGSIDPQSSACRVFKRFIRRSDALASMRDCGLARSQVQFLDLPFYQQGYYRRFHPGEEDVRSLVALLDFIQPHQIFMTGSEADPTNLKGVCFSVFLQAWEGVAKAAWRKDCLVWLFPEDIGHWPMYRIDMAVPLSPTELRKKIRGICQQTSLVNQTPFFSAARAGVWELSSETDCQVARLYHQFGLAHYEAIESFVRWSN